MLFRSIFPAINNGAEQITAKLSGAGRNYSEGYDDMYFGIGGLEIMIGGNNGIYTYIHGEPYQGNVHIQSNRGTDKVLVTDEDGYGGTIHLRDIRAGLTATVQHGGVSYKTTVLEPENPLFSAHYWKAMEPIILMVIVSIVLVAAIC